MRVTRLALGLVMIAACGDDASAPDARDGTGAATDGPPVATLSCAEIATRLQARAAATSTACDTASDCLAIGYPVRNDGFPTCNCGVAFARSCGGDPVNAVAWGADADAVALEAEWTGRCVPAGPASGAPTFCDCGRGTVSCVGNRCGASTFSCFGDAGVL